MELRNIFRSFQFGTKYKFNVLNRQLCFVHWLIFDLVDCSFRLFVKSVPVNFVWRHKSRTDVFEVSLIFNYFNISSARLVTVRYPQGPLSPAGCPPPELRFILIDKDISSAGNIGPHSPTSRSTLRTSRTLRRWVQYQVRHVWAKGKAHMFYTVHVMFATYLNVNLAFRWISFHRISIRRMSFRRTSFCWMSIRLTACHFLERHLVDCHSAAWQHLFPVFSLTSARFAMPSRVTELWTRISHHNSFFRSLAGVYLPPPPGIPFSCLYRYLQFQVSAHYAELRKVNSTPSFILLVTVSVHV